MALDNWFPHMDHLTLYKCHKYQLKLNMHDFIFYTIEQYKDACNFHVLFESSHHWFSTLSVPNEVWNNRHILDNANTKVVILIPP